MTSPARLSELSEYWAESLPKDDKDASPAWLRSLKATAASEYLRHGLPGNKDEAWKYTSLRRLEELKPALAAFASTTRLPSPHARLPETGEFGFRIIEGRPEWMATAVPQGVTLLKLAHALARSDVKPLQRLQAILESTRVNGRSHAFEALNTAMLQDGVVVHVAAGVDAGNCLVHWLPGGFATPRLVNFRLILILEAGARLDLREQFHEPEQGSPVEQVGQAHNLLLQAELAPDSELSHVRLQSLSANDLLFTFNFIEQSGGSRYTYSGFDLGGKLVRHDIQCRLTGPRAQAVLEGAYVLSGERHTDNHLCVDHVAPACASEQFFRGVLAGRSRGVFNGRALIRPGADGSKVRQSNANLLLSELAEMDTKPELEIYADEVEASHGATVGQMDEQAVFYLRSRGLPEEAARRMLTSAFCRAVSGRLANRALAEQVDQMLEISMQDIDVVPDPG